MMNKTAGIVLAGGKSRRMGCDKSALKINGVSLLEHMQSLLLATNIDDVFISGKLSGKRGIIDLVANQGPLMAILSCLRELQQFHYLLFVPVDMPLLNAEILNHLQANITDDFVCYDGYNLPILIKNTKSVKTAIESQLAKQQRSIYALLKVLNGHYIKMNYAKEHFINTNNPQQWQQVIEKIQSKN